MRRSCKLLIDHLLFIYQALDNRFDFKNTGNIYSEAALLGIYIFSKAISYIIFCDSVESSGV
jgi:hypothetical protein